jgi:hypothetical protein
MWQKARHEQQAVIGLQVWTPAAPVRQILGAPKKMVLLPNRGFNRMSAAGTGIQGPTSPSRSLADAARNSGQPGRGRLGLNRVLAIPVALSRAIAYKHRLAQGDRRAAFQRPRSAGSHAGRDRYCQAPDGFGPCRFILAPAESATIRQGPIGRWMVRPILRHHRTGLGARAYRPEIDSRGRASGGPFQSRKGTHLAR